MSEEEKAALEFIKINNKHRYCDKDDVDFLLNLIENQQKELDNLKEIEKSHQEENGKLRVEYEKVYEDNLTLVDKLKLQKEKNELFVVSGNSINLERHIKNNYISKDKIKEKIEENKKLLDECDNGDIRKILHDEIRILKEMLEEK